MTGVTDYEVQNPASPQILPVPVKIVNTEDFPQPYTPPDAVEVMVPETFVAVCFTYAPGGAQSQQIAQQSPLRQALTISGTGTGNVRLCHSKNSADDVVRNGAASSEGMPITLPFAPFTLSSTGPLWAVGELGSTTFNIGVLSQERQR
jgi:hypothetical protein